MIKVQSYSISNIPLTNKILEAYINNFWGDVFSSLISSSTGDKHLMLKCKVEFNELELGYRTTFFICPSSLPIIYSGNGLSVTALSVSE